MTTTDPASRLARTTPAPSAARAESGSTGRPDPLDEGAQGRSARLRGLVSQVSVRTRIAVVVALLTALGLTGSGLLVYALERTRIETAMKEQIEQEVEEFRTLQAEGVDPRTGREFTDVAALVRLFIERNVPDDDETIYGYWDGRLRAGSLGSPHPAFAGSPLLAAVIDRRAAAGGSERVETRHGEVVVTIVPALNRETAGALVLVNFLRDEYGELNQTISTYAVTAAVLLLLVSGVAAWQAGRLLAPLRDLRDTAQDISGSDLARRIPVRGNDDITALTRTVNSMLDRLESSFTGQREFLDDAGHELRTPLTVVQGHLELLDAGDAAEVEATRLLLLDEVDRMARLVQDLIMLAKTDRPDFVRPGPCAVGPLTDAVLDKCRALGRRRWVLDDRAELLAVVDEQRMTQALLQLAQNAVKHTTEGAVIGLGSRVSSAAELLLWVRDTGHGVADADKHRVFRRFARAEVTADDEGFGLGLSIVSAIAAAHGGRATLTDTVGGGATVTLRLPLPLSPGRADQSDQPDRREQPGEASWPAS